jgi:hypothetical protein
VQGRLGGSSEMGTIIGLFQPFRLWCRGIKL